MADSQLTPSLPSLEHRSTMTDKELSVLLPTLTIEQRIETVIAKYVGGATSREYDGETEAPKAHARIASYLLRKMRPWLLPILLTRDELRVVAVLVEYEILRPHHTHPEDRSGLPHLETALRKLSSLRRNEARRASPMRE